MLGDADGMVQRRDVDRRRQADVFRARRDIGEHELRRGKHAERVEMMFADPGRMHAELVGVDRLVGDVGDELVGAARIVGVGVVAEGEVSELHGVSPLDLALSRAAR
jgi:hypothetical protein